MRMQPTLVSINYVVIIRTSSAITRPSEMRRIAICLDVVTDEHFSIFFVLFFLIGACRNGRYLVQMNLINKRAVLWHTFHSICCWWLWSGQYWLGATVVISHRLHQWRRTLLKYSCVLNHQWVLKVRILKNQHLRMCKEPYKSIQIFGDLFIKARLCICVSINWDGSASWIGAFSVQGDMLTPKLAYFQVSS